MKDLIILGNGMAGMTAALYAKRANLDFKIVGRDEYDFGQIEIPPMSVIPLNIDDFC